MNSNWSSEALVEMTKMDTWNTSRSQPMCWDSNLTFWKNRSVQFPKPKYPIFTVIIWSIFLIGDQLYIFHKLDHTGMFFRLCTCFSNNLVQFHSRNKEVLQTTRIWIQTEVLKPSSRRSKWIYGTHDLKHERGSYDILKRLQAAKTKVSVWETGGSVSIDQIWIWLEIFTIFD
jgi:hypothetical protein